MYTKVKTTVPKYGDINSYKDKPVLDKTDYHNGFSSKVIGVIADAVEVDDGYELTINLFSTTKFEWIGDQINAISILNKVSNTKSESKKTCILSPKKE